MDTQRNYEHEMSRIRQAFPQADLASATVNVDGLVNIVIIAGRRVYRFARNETGKAALQHEALILKLVQTATTLAVPKFEMVADDFVTYELIAGQPLVRNDILRLPVVEQDRLAEQLAMFLRHLHSIPVEVLEMNGIRASDGRQTQAEWLGLYEAVQTELYPLMYRVTRDWVQQHFAPLLHDDDWLRFQSVLIHDDLAQYHILYNPDRHLINGIIDFGTAGRGDPARDYGLLMNVYGETFVNRMANFDSRVESFIDRARFYSGTYELQWVLGGMRSRSFDWFTAHLDRARDVMPYGSRLAQ
jgi:aminoglycoside 2''-phosphotransferase